MTPLTEEIRRRNMDRCKYCQGEVLWATVPPKDPTQTGKAVQLEPEPAYGGNVAIDVDDVGMLRARAVKPVGTVEAYVMHKTICSAVDEHTHLPRQAAALDHDEQRAAKLRALQVRMPFGQYEGQTIEEIDRSGNGHAYLQWAVKGITWRNTNIRDAIALVVGVEP